MKAFSGLHRFCFIAGVLAFTAPSGFAGETGVKLWTKQLGAAGANEGWGVSVDSSGNAFVTGRTSGGLDGNTSQGYYDIFLTKYDTNGNKLWTKQPGTASDDIAMGVAVDSSGKVFVTGYTGGGLDGNTNQGSMDMFLTKYDTSGTRLWTKQLGTAANDYGRGVAVDSSGNAFVVGDTFGGLDGNTNQGSNDIFLAKYDTNGNKLWTKQLGTTTSDEGVAVAVDPDGDIFVTGDTLGGLDGNTNQGNRDMFLTKYDTNGNILWTKQLGTTTLDYGMGVAVDSSSNAFVTGYTAGGIDGNTNQGNNDMFLTKYDTDGTKLWTKQLGTASFDFGRAVTVDSLGNAFVAGDTEGGIDGNTNQGASDMFLTKYDTDGIKLWTKQLGTSAIENGLGIAIDSSRKVFITGYTYGGLDGNTNQGSADIFLTKYKTNTFPTLTWTGEANYTADGLNPETGDQTTSLVFHVSYIDSDNDTPATGYPKLHIKKGSVEVSGSPFVMSYVSGANTTGAIYSYSKIITSTGTNYTYYFEAQDPDGGVATGAPTSAVDAPDVSNTAPTLTWTGETNYITGGLNPSVGNIATNFIYRVKYVDLGNDAPASGYPKVHVKKGGIEVAGSPFAMTYVSGAYNTGAVYSYSKTLVIGTDYTYYFEAQDTYNDAATGTPLTTVDSPDVNSAPTLDWTGEANYTTDGVHPETGLTSTTIIYRVKYNDGEADAPASGYPKVHIKKSGAEIVGSPFPMSYVSGAYDAGAIYTYSTILALGTDYTYYFEAQDVNTNVATGDPLAAIDAPNIKNAPILAWTGALNYASDGLTPEAGDVTTSYVYRVKYTDADNDAPASGYPKLHITKGGIAISGSPFAMSLVSGAYSTGAIYSYAKTLEPGTDYAYYFEAQDLDTNIASGTPLTTTDAPDVSDVAQAEHKTTIGDNFFNPKTGGASKIKFNVTTPGRVSLKIYNLSGKFIRTVFEGDVGVGNNQQNWDGKDDSGRFVIPGVYFLHYVYPGGKEVRKIGVRK